MSQTVSENSEQKDPEKTEFSTLGVGGLLGKFYHNHYESCDDPTYVDKHEFYGAGIGYSKTFKKSRFKYENYGSNFYFVRDNKYRTTSTMDQDGISYIENSIAINPFAKFGGKWIGIGFGFHLGELRFASSYKVTNNTGSGGWLDPAEKVEDLTTHIFYPQGSIRVGPRHILNLEFKWADHFPSSSLMPLYKLELGSGFGTIDKHYFSFGYSDECLSFNGTAAIYKNWLINAFYMQNFESERYLREYGSLSIQYRIYQTTSKVHK